MCDAPRLLPVRVRSLASWGWLDGPRRGRPRRLWSRARLTDSLASQTADAPSGSRRCSQGSRPREVSCRRDSPQWPRRSRRAERSAIPKRRRPWTARGADTWAPAWSTSASCVPPQRRVGAGDRRGQFYSVSRELRPRQGWPRGSVSGLDMCTSFFAVLRPDKATDPPWTRVLSGFRTRHPRPFAKTPFTRTLRDSGPAAGSGVRIKVCPASPSSADTTSRPSLPGARYTSVPSGRGGTCRPRM